MVECSELEVREKKNSGYLSGSNDMKATLKSTELIRDSRNNGTSTAGDEHTRDSSLVPDSTNSTYTTSQIAV